MSSILPSALFGLLGFFSTSTWAAGCAFEPPATVITEAGEAHEPSARLFQVWDLPDSPALWASETPDSPGYAAFRRDLEASGLETDPIDGICGRDPSFGGWETSADLSLREKRRRVRRRWVSSSRRSSKIIAMVRRCKRCSTTTISGSTRTS